MENVLDVLLYLFENYREGELADGALHANLKLELEQAGFPSQEVDQAFTWLSSLSQTEADMSSEDSISDAIRVFPLQEAAVIPASCQGFLLHLEQLGILSPISREQVIDRLLALANGEAVDLDQLKWVILMVLFSQSGDRAAYVELEEMMYSYDADMLH